MSGFILFYNFLFSLIPGMRLGYMQMKLGLLRLISKYEFSPCEGASRENKFDTRMILMNFKNDVILNVRKL
jgi:hypothetical protein